MNMCYVSAWLGMATGIWWQQMSSLHTALDLLQNGGITSGIDMFLNVFWTLHDGAKVLGANVCGQELQWLFTKYTCCMLRICKWIWDVYGATSFSWMCMMFLTIGLTRFSTTNWNRFSATLRLHFFLEAGCRFTTTSWRRRMFLEFVRSLRCFWNVCGEFNTCEFTPMEMDNSLSVNGWEFVFRFPLPLPRRQSWNKSDTTQCMLHVKQTTLSFRFPVWKRVERLVQCKPLFWVFLCFFKHSTWRRPTPLRALATSGCN